MGYGTLFYPITMNYHLSWTLMGRGKPRVLADLAPFNSFVTYQFNIQQVECCRSLDRVCAANAQEPDGQNLELSQFVS